MQQSSFDSECSTMGLEAKQSSSALTMVALMQTSTSLAQPAQADQDPDLTNIAQQNIAAGCVLERLPVNVHLDPW